MTERLGYLKDGAEIYRRSFATIRAETDLSRIPDDLKTVAVRMVHARAEWSMWWTIWISAPTSAASARAALKGPEHPYWSTP